MRTLFPIFTLAISLGLGGCIILDRTPGIQDIIPYERPDRAPQRFERVALIPFEIEGFDDKTAASFREELRGAITQRGLFEALPISERDLDDINLSSARNRGTYSTEDLRALNRRFGVDGVLAGSITESRTYPSIRLGVRLFLLDCRTGRVAWASDFRLDANDQRVAADAHNYYDVHYQDPNRSLIEHEKVLISPRLFRQFVADRTIATLDRALKRRPAPPSSDP
ncbi:MAG: hypothetical protein V3W41_17200 [Planctomycetota bacterium]